MKSWTFLPMCNKCFSKKLGKKIIYILFVSKAHPSMNHGDREKEQGVLRKRYVSILLSAFIGFVVETKLTFRTSSLLIVTTRFKQIFTQKKDYCRNCSDADKTIWIHWKPTGKTSSAVLGYQREIGGRDAPVQTTCQGRACTWVCTCACIRLTPSMIIRLFTDAPHFLTKCVDSDPSHLISSPAPTVLSGCLLQSISVLAASAVRWRKVLAADQMLRNEEASSACYLARDFEGDWPSRRAHRNTSVSPNNKSSLIASNSVTIKEVVWEADTF